MGLELPPNQLQLHKKIDEILWKDWDPLGVSGDASAREEYNGYLFQVFKMLMENSGHDQIAAYLCRVEVADMCLPGDKDKCLKVAEKVVAAKKAAGV
jgi:hypothetical protein